MKLFHRRKRPTASDIAEYMRSRNVDYPDWLTAYYLRHRGRFPDKVADSLARDLKMEPLIWKDNEDG